LFYLSIDGVAKTPQLLRSLICLAITLDDILRVHQVLMNENISGKMPLIQVQPVKTCEPVTKVIVNKQVLGQYNRFQKQGGSFYGCFF